MFRPTHRPLVRTATGLLTVLVAASLMSACTQPEQPNPLPHCDSKAAAVAVYWSDSGSERDSAIDAQRLKTVRQSALLAASCSAALSVALVPAEANTTVLYSGSVRHAGGTSSATARLSTRFIDQTVMPAITTALNTQLKVPAPAISSPSALFQVAADRLVGEPARNQVILLSDFVQHDATVDLDRALTAADVTKAAAAPVVATDLGGATIEIYGAGATRDTAPAPSDWIDQVRTYALSVCQRTHATCRVETQYPTT